MTLAASTLWKKFSTENLIYDPFNRDEKYNRRVLNRLQR